MGMQTSRRSRFYPLPSGRWEHKTQRETPTLHMQGQTFVLHGRAGECKAVAKRPLLRFGKGNMTFLKSCVALYAIVISMLSVCSVSLISMVANGKNRRQLAMFLRLLILLGGSLFVYASSSLFSKEKVLAEPSLTAKSYIPYHTLLFLLLLS